MTDKIPLVSVIIPMFNSAKFIPQTLESLCYQTMKDFDVVVVDDGSTDNSVEVVESFSERFGGRLHVIKLPNNTGTPGLPRNVGIQFARGKYIAFLDSDDLYTKTALEELTTLAEEYQADVIQCYSRFILWGGKERSIDDPSMTNFAELTNPKNFGLHSCQNKKLVEPTLEPEDISERLRKWLSMPANGFWTTCFFFCQRDFLIENQIFFSAMPTCEDMLFAFDLLCSANRYLNASNVTTIARPRDGSASRDRQDKEKFFIKRICTLENGFNELERILSKVPFFENRPDYRYAVLEWFVNARIPITLDFYIKNPPFELNEIVKQKFHPDNAAFSAYLFNAVNIHKLQLMRLQQVNNVLRKELQKYRSEQ